MRQVVLIRCKDFLSTSRRPQAEAAASPAGWPPPKHLSPFKMVFDRKWYKRVNSPPLYHFPGWTFFLGGASPRRGLAPPPMPLLPCRNPLLKIWHKFHLNYLLSLRGRFALGNDEKVPVAIGEGLSSGPAAKEKKFVALHNQPAPPLR